MDLPLFARSVWIGALFAILLSGCQTCATPTLNHMTLTQPAPEWKWARSSFGLLSLQDKAGLTLNLLECGDGQGPKKLCLSVELAEGNRFRFVDQQVTVSGIGGKSPQRFDLGAVKYMSSCTVPWKDYGHACPMGPDKTPAVDPGALETETHRKPVGRMFGPVFVREIHSFDPRLEFQGSTDKRFTLFEDMRWRPHEVVLLDDAYVAPDYVLTLPRMTLNGRELHVPPIRFHRATERMCAPSV